jgi:hypothetical protein
LLSQHANRACIAGNLVAADSILNLGNIPLVTAENSVKPSIELVSTSKIKRIVDYGMISATIG